MSKRKPDIHTVKNPGGGWDNKQGGEVLSHHRTQASAADAARRQARRDAVDHVIHGENGRIRAKNSYGNDPNPPKDQR